MRKVNLFIIYVIIVLQLNFYYLVPFSASYYQFQSYTSKYLTLLMMLALIIINVKNIPILFQKYHTFVWTEVVTLLLALVLIVVSARKYSQSLNDTFHVGHQYFLLLLVFAMIIARFSKFDLLKIEKFITWSAFFVSCLLLLQAVLYPKGITFLQFQDVSAIQPAQFLFGIPRIAQASDFVSFSILIIAFSFVDSHYLKTAYKLILPFDLLYIVLVGQTRMYMILDVIIVVTAILLVFLKKDVNFGFIVGMLLLAAMIMVVPSVFKHFVTGSRSVSYSVRMEAYNFYLSVMPHNTLLGIGFPGSAQDYILHGNLLTILGYQYYLDDLGIFGFYVQFGVSAIIVLIAFIVETFRGWYRTDNKQVMFLSFVYIGISSISLSLLNPQRIIYMAAILFIIDTYNKNKEISDPFNGIMR
ncbi:hypothetical protein Nizo1840_3004 [Lactiplantibacillus plantarum]|nr:hypothetical protein Nizo1840_3004 [Lactiplantibacillus plantarum]